MYGCDSNITVTLWLYCRYFVVANHNINFNLLLLCMYTIDYNHNEPIMCYLYYLSVSVCLFAVV